MTEVTENELNESQPVLPTLPISRLNLILLGAVVVQVIIAVIVFWPRGAATTGAPLLGDVTADDVTAFTITNAEGETLTLAQEGEAWVLPDAGNFPALAENVTEVVDKLVAITDDRLVARTADSHARLQVAEENFVNKVDITTGGETQTLYIGSAPATGATHVRLEGENSTYLTNQVASWELNTDASGWIDALYLSVPADDVTRLVLENPQGTFTLTRSLGEDGTPGDWTLAELGDDQTLDQSTVSTLLSRVNALRMVAPVGIEVQPEYGLADPLATVTLTAVDDEGNETVHTLNFGVQDSDANYYVKSADSEYVVLVASFTGDALRDQALADFVAQAEATEEGAGTDAGAFPTFEGAADGAGASEGITTTEAITATESVTATGAVTAAEDVTATQPVTTTDAN